MNVLDLLLWDCGRIDALREALGTLVVLGQTYDVVVLHPMTFDALGVIASDGGSRVVLRPDGDLVLCGTRFRSGGRP